MAAGVISLAAAPAALGATALKYLGGAYYQAAAGEANQLQVTGTNTVVTFDDVVPIADGDGAGGCEVDPVDNTIAVCPADSPGSDLPFVLVLTGDLDDSVAVAENITVDTAIFGGAGNDTLDGGGGDDTVQGGDGTDTLTGGDGNDTVQGDADNDTLTGDDGADWVAGGAGDDVVNGNAGDDGVVGGPGADLLDGGTGDDTDVRGGPDDDTVRGGDGNDTLSGDCFGYETCGAGADGDDTVEGGGGEDVFEPDGGADTYLGGSGLDQITYDTGTSGTPTPVTVSLDDQPGDGHADEGDNVRSDVEDVFFAGEGGGTLVGSGGINSLSGSDGNDSIDGGAGNDFLSGNAGDDTLSSRDGYADRVDCGPGADTANVDTLDLVADNCETVNRADAGNANEDRPPTVAWVTPAPGATMSTTSGNLLQVNAADDRGISMVQFMDDDQIVCADDTAPYTCDYRPRGEDVGRNTLIAVAIDTSQQTATAVRTVNVPRFKPRLSSRTRPARDGESPFRFTTRGRLNLPAGVTPAQGCKGRVAVQIKAGKKTVSTRRARVRPNCTFRSRVTFTLPRRLNPERLRVFTRFQGNTVLRPDRGPRRTVRVK